MRPYALTIPSKLLKLISHCLVLPAREPITWNGQDSQPEFPSQNLEVNLKGTCLLQDLVDLQHELHNFVQPLLSISPSNQDVLVFFTITSSAIFNRHMMVRLQQLEVSLHNESTVSSTTSLELLTKALRQTYQLLCKVIGGRATYGELTAEEKVELTDFDIEEEIKKLEASQSILLLEVESPVRLSGMKFMLELLKYAHHVRQLANVLQLYKVRTCLEDSNFQEIFRIAKDLEGEEYRRMLDTQMASESLTKMKTVLSIPPGMSSDCLNFLTVVGQSQEFFQFLVNRRFVGPQGLRQFRLQYEIITTHLQHTDYDERVLNQLMGAFLFITPFVACRLEEKADKDETYFCQLMSQLMAQDIINGPKQLDTMNRNLHLIQLWFSQVEVS